MPIQSWLDTNIQNDTASYSHWVLYQTANRQMYWVRISGVQSYGVRILRAPIRVTSSIKWSPPIMTWPAGWSRCTRLIRWHGDWLITGVHGAVNREMTLSQRWNYNAVCLQVCCTTTCQIPVHFGTRYHVDDGIGISRRRDMHATIILEPECRSNIQIKCICTMQSEPTHYNKTTFDSFYRPMHVSNSTKVRLHQCQLKVNRLDSLNSINYTPIRQSGDLWAGLILLSLIVNTLLTGLGATAGTKWTISTLCVCFLRTRWAERQSQHASCFLLFLHIISLYAISEVGICFIAHSSNTESMTFMTCRTITILIQLNPLNH